MIQLGLHLLLTVLSILTLTAAFGVLIATPLIIGIPLSILIGCLGLAFAAAARILVKRNLGI